MKDPEKEGGACAFVMPFVNGLHADISAHLQQSVMCWQAKGIDDILKYAKYLRDWLEMKQKHAKEKLMIAQTRQLQGLQNDGVVQMHREVRAKE